MPETSTLPPIIDHFDGFGLNDRLIIERDARDPDAGNASHEYSLCLRVAPEEPWQNANGACGACGCTGECLQHAGGWIRCAACGMYWSPAGQEAAPEIRVGTLQFQHGPRNVEGSTPGLLDPALVAVLLDRYRGFQSGLFRCDENGHVIRHLTEALLWMHKRALTRTQRGVLGTNLAHKTAE